MCGVSGFVSAILVFSIIIKYNCARRHAFLRHKKKKNLCARDNSSTSVTLGCAETLLLDSLSGLFSLLIYSWDKKSRNPDTNIYEVHFFRPAGWFHAHSHSFFCRCTFFSSIYIVYLNFFCTSWYRRLVELGKWPYSIHCISAIQCFRLHRFSVCYLFERTSLNKNNNSSSSRSSNTKYGLQMANVVICSKWRKTHIFYTCCTSPVLMYLVVWAWKEWKEWEW